MEINEFVEKFAEQFEDTDPAIFNPNTHFHELEEWSSLAALSIMAMADEEYGVSLKGEDFVVAQTIEDIFNVVKSRA